MINRHVQLPAKFHGETGFADFLASRCCLTNRSKDIGDDSLRVLLEIASEPQDSFHFLFKVVPCGSGATTISDTGAFAIKVIYSGPSAAYDVYQSRLSS
jgi:hypothetical protein